MLNRCNVDDNDVSSFSSRTSLDLLLSLVGLVSGGHILYMAYVAEAMSDRTSKENAHLLRAEGVWVIPTIPPPV